MVRSLLLAQWICVLLYAKFGYDAVGDSAAHWARFFYISNQVIVCIWLYLFYKNRIRKCEEPIMRTAFWFNVFLILIWGQYYVPIWHDIIVYSGIFIPIVSYITLYLFITYLINFNKNK